MIKYFYVSKWEKNLVLLRCSLYCQLSLSLLNMHVLVGTCASIWNHKLYPIFMALLVLNYLFKFIIKSTSIIFQNCSLCFQTNSSDFNIKGFTYRMLSNAKKKLTRSRKIMNRLLRFLEKLRRYWKKKKKLFVTYSSGISFSSTNYL